MSPDEILADLRDIHLPAAEAETIATGFNFWPLLIVCMCLGIVLLVRLWRRGAERRALRNAIEAFAASPADPGIHELLSLRQQAAAMGVRLPALPMACFSAEGANDNAVLVDAGHDLRRAMDQ